MTLWKPNILNFWPSWPYILKHTLALSWPNDVRCNLVSCYSSNSQWRTALTDNTIIAKPSFKKTFWFFKRRIPTGWVFFTQHFFKQEVNNLVEITGENPSLFGTFIRWWEIDLSDDHHRCGVMCIKNQLKFHQAKWFWVGEENKRPMFSPDHDVRKCFRIEKCLLPVYFLSLNRHAREV